MTRTTLDSVAERARVSRQTVSNVLNAPHLVREDTAQRVREAIDELGYRPSRAARQMRTRRSMLLGLRLEPDRDGINGALLDRFLHACVESAQGLGYRVVLFTADDDDAEIASYADLLSAEEADGFVLTSTHQGDPRTRWLADRGVPFSTFGRPWGATDQHHSWVDVDGAAGTRAAVRHLVSQGHRRIGYLGGPRDAAVGDDRRDGWRAGVRAAGLPASRELQAAVEDGVAQGRDAARRMLDRPDPPTAIVCASDSLALGVLAAAPDLAVTGFDDTPVARAVGLTSVTQPVVPAAAQCVSQVLDVVTSRAQAPEHVLLAPTLSVRTSTPPPTRGDRA